jgi:hypothetical protein
MSDIKQTSVTSPEQPNKNPPSSDSAASKQLDRDADKMANRANEVEDRYDENHDIFTK